MPAYCTIQDVRDEGLSAAVADDARVTALIREASEWIDRMAGWWFEERTQTLRLDGKGTRWLHLPAPILEVTEVRRVYRQASPDQSSVLDDDLYVVYDRADPDDRWNAKLTLYEGMSWEDGLQNYEVDGTFGFVDDDGAGGTETPLPIRRACMLLVVRNASGIATAGGAMSSLGGDVRSITVQGRSQTWGGPTSAQTLSGLPEVDRILAQYRAPMSMVAA